MERIKIKLSENLVVEGIPLAIYTRKKTKIVLEKKKFLFFQYNRNKNLVLNNQIWLVFIPYQHRLKEIIEVDEENIIKNNFKVIPTWAKVESFTSEAFEYPEAQYKDRLIIKNFLGYKFIYEHNEFICNLVLGNANENLDILYKEMPEILNEKFNEEK